MKLLNLRAALFNTLREIEQLKASIENLQYKVDILEDMIKSEEVKGR